MRKQVKENQILSTVTVCPYCMEPAGAKLSCCGENHFETAYEIENRSELYLEHEIELIDYDTEDRTADTAERQLEDLKEGLYD